MQKIAYWVEGYEVVADGKVYFTEYNCSNCGEASNERLAVCPNCGADMRIKWDR